ncbi:MAG: ankyrin repeat domain-containing protein [Verrucomicrobiaceae bacterium]|nr:ankyrin repeat domain-containing protein [Verrucomicrobiaceae bacterium]
MNAPSSFRLFEVSRKGAEAQRMRFLNLCASAPLREFLLMFLACSLQAADTNPIAEKLRQGLFAEEAERDLEKAAKAYEAAVQLYNADRRQAATALFRLAEIRRKQGDAKEAAQLYQRVLAEFADDEALARLSRENLAGMGVSPAAPAPTVNDEVAEIARLESLFKTSPDLVNSEQKDGMPPPLHHAAWRNQLRVVTFLLEKGCQLDLRESAGRTALDMACAAGHLEMAKLLISKGADIHGKDKGSTPLGAALMNKRSQLARLLIEKGADVNRVFYEYNKEKKAAFYQTPLTMVTQQGDSALFDLLIAHKADLHASQLTTDVNKLGWNYPPVLIAAHNNAPELLKRLLAAGASPELPPGMPGDSPLSQALQLGHLECVTLLLDSKAKIQQDVMSYAARLGKEDFFLRLIQAGGDINEVSQYDTPLIHAAKQEAQKVPDSFLHFLIKHGASAKKALGQNRPPVSSGGMYYGMTFERAQIVRSTLYAEWFAQPQITWAPQNTSMPVQQSPDDPAPLVCDLVNEFSSLQKAFIVRKAANEAGFERIPLDMKAWADTGGDHAKLPELRWGDVIEFDEWGKHEDSPRIADMLRAARRVPFSVTIDGLKNDFVLHGGAEIFDPTQNLVPGSIHGFPSETLRSMQSVLELLGVNDPRCDSSAVEYVTGPAGKRRKATLDLTQRNAESRIQPGDEFVFPLRKVMVVNARPRIISPGLPLSRAVNQHMTLLEALAAFLNDSEIVLPHPDWSKLVLRRWDEKKKAHEPKPINLAAAMADGTLFEDIPLQLGDLIELPVRESESGKPWTGPDEAVVRFFQRSLARTVMLNDGVAKRELRLTWFTPRLRLESGLWHRQDVPVENKAEGHITSMTTSALSEALNRANGEQGQARHFHEVINGIRDTNLVRDSLLRDGDTWLVKVSVNYVNPQPNMINMPGVPQPVPRPRIGVPSPR